MRDHSQHIEFSRAQAVKSMVEAAAFPTLGQAKTDLVPLSQAFGRVLAQDVHSKVDMPTCLTCCMDSIAVHWSDFQDGAQPDTSTWVRGIDWTFANTGIAMPEGFDTAIVIENVEVSADEQSVKLLAYPTAQFAGTRPAGEKLQRGALIHAAGTVITPDVAADLAAGNVSKVAVVAKPRVAFIPTGNELVAPGLPYSPNKSYAGYGKNIETNSLLVQGKVQTWGGEYIGFDIVPDEPELISTAIKQACALADIVVLNAGSSKGSDDWSVEQMEQLGQVFYHETNHGPGHHSSFALVDGTPVVGISGPAGGASFTLDFYLLPLMQAYLCQQVKPRLVKAKLTEAFPARKGHGGPKKGEARPSVVQDAREFFGVKPVYLEMGEDGTMLATPVAGRPGSSEAARANALYMLSNKPEKIPAVGSIIEVELR